MLRSTERGRGQSSVEHSVLSLVLRVGFGLATLSCARDAGAAVDDRPHDTSHADRRRDAALEAAFYEKDGRLEITDTTLRLGDGAFSMETARYQARLAAELTGSAPIEYRHEDLRLAFTPTGLAWSGENRPEMLLRPGVQPVGGRLVADAQEIEGSPSLHRAGNGLIYENAYGAGLHLGVLTTNQVFRKIVRFDRLESLGAVPDGAEFLEVGFQLDADEATTFRAAFGSDEPRFWDRAETVVTRAEPVELGKAGQRSFIQPAHAWDSVGDRIPLELEFRSEGGRLFLTKLIPVAWLRRAVFPVFADVDLTFGLPSTFNAAGTNRMSVTPLDSTRVVIAFEDSANGTFGTAVVGTISGKTISFGPEWVFNNASTVVVRLSATTLDSDHVVIAYWDVGNVKTAIVGTVAGTTITFGSEYVFQGAAAATGGLATAALDSTHVAIAYQDTANGSFGTAIVGTISGGDVITFGAPYVFRAGVTNFPSAAALDSTHFVAAYRAGGAGTPGTAVVGTVSSGDVIAYGPAAVFNPADTGAITPARLDDSHVLIAYGDTGNSGFGTAIVGTVSGGNNLSFGSEFVYNASTNNGYNVATSLDSNHVVIAFAGSTAVNDGAAIVGTISGGSNICFGAAFAYGPASISQPSVRALDATRFVIGYRDDGSTFGTTIVGETSTLQRLIGFETQSGNQEMISLSLDSGFGSVGVRPGSGSYFLEQAVGPSTLVQGLSTCEGKIGVRFSFRKPANPAADQVLLQFINGATNLWSLRLRTDGRLQVQQDQVLGLTTTAGTTALADNVWYTVRLVYDRAAGGVLKVWLNLPLEIDATHTAAGTTVDGILVSGPANPNGYHYDDFTIADSTNPPKFGQIVERVLVAAGSLTQFDTPSPSLLHYENVDEVFPVVTDFNQHGASTVATDLYALADAPVGAINGVKGMFQMSRSGGASAGGTHDYAWRENGVNRSAAFAGITTGFTTLEVVWETPPNSGGTWTTPGTWNSPKFDALELGASHNGTQGQDTIISWTAAMVDYNDSSTTAVTLTSFTASGHDGEVELEWETASELQNLGFHLYRSLSADGPYERITSSLIPGLGSSPTGRSYSYRDGGLVNGRTYYYELEDVETTGRTARHGPVSATPTTGTSGGGGSGGGPGGSTYGDPVSVVLREVERSSHHVVLELLTGGFVAWAAEGGRVRLRIPGFESVSRPGEPSLPTRRVFVEAASGRKVRLAAVRASDELRFPGLRPVPQGLPGIDVDEEGTVLASEEKRREGSAFQGSFPEEAALLLGGVFQGETKKAEVLLFPLRWDGSGLTLSRRLLVRLEFTGVEGGETSRGGSRGRRLVERPSHARRGVVAQITVKDKGLYRVDYEDVFPPAVSRRPRGLPASSLRLSRQGEAVAFHLEPARAPFGPGSSFYFLSEGSSLNPYGDAVYELETNASGIVMGEETLSPTTARGLGEYFETLDREENHYYQAGLLDAPDLWLWDVVVSPGSRSYGFSLESLASTSSMGRLSVEMQGASDFLGVSDHHVRVRVNGRFVGETIWDGKQPKSLEVELEPGVLREGANTLDLEDVGDAGALYSMVFLNRFRVSYPRQLVAVQGTLEGTFERTGLAEIEGALPSSFVLDTTGIPRWLRGASVTPTGLGVPVAGGRSYLVTATVLRPAVRCLSPSGLRSPTNRADYLLLGPQAFLAAAQPLLDLRESQGLVTKAVSLEEVYEQFGYGEASPGAIKEFLEYAYHSWAGPSVRYVVLLGDASYDPKDYLQTGVKDRLPGFPVKTRYLWTVSDPTYASVNGEDLLPDVAIGRLPAGNLDEAMRMVEKMLRYENGGGSLDGPAVLVADNPDLAGNFEANADEIAATVLAGRSTRKIYYSQLGSSTRAEIKDAFDRGASLMSYVGHGATAVWASENIFNYQDVASLMPQPRQPLLLTLNCLNGFFHFPPLDSLSEALLKAEGKGAVAAFSPSGLSVNDAAHLFHKALLQEIVSGRHSRIGDAVLAAQEAYARTGAYPELLSVYNLLGDPATGLQ